MEITFAWDSIWSMDWDGCWMCTNIIGWTHLQHNSVLVFLVLVIKKVNKLETLLWSSELIRLRMNEDHRDYGFNEMETGFQNQVNAGKGSQMNEYFEEWIFEMIFCFLFHWVSSMISGILFQKMESNCREQIFPSTFMWYFYWFPSVCAVDELDEDYLLWEEHIFQVLWSTSSVHLGCWAAQASEFSIRFFGSISIRNPLKWTEH